MITNLRAYHHLTILLIKKENSFLYKKREENITFFYRIRQVIQKVKDSESMSLTSD